MPTIHQMPSIGDYTKYIILYCFVFAQAQNSGHPPIYNFQTNQSKQLQETSHGFLLVQ